MTLRVPADLAKAKWANCGPAAIAAACGLDLADVKRAVGSGKARRFKGHMGVHDITRALGELERPIRSTTSRPGEIETWPREGIHIGMVQALGPWDRNPEAAARRRHLVAVRWSNPYPWKSANEYAIWRVYDVNWNQWIPGNVWARLLMTPLCRKLWPESTGWRFSWRGTIKA